LLHANKNDPDCAFSCSYAAELFSFAVLSTAKEKDPFLCALCDSAVRKDKGVVYVQVKKNHRMRAEFQ
jgi:hypothetical protein